MWDLDGKEVSHLANYESVVNNLATHTKAFKNPVLLLNGDSHAYRSDNPLQKRRRAPVTRTPAPMTTGRAIRRTTLRTSTASWSTGAPSRWSTCA